MPTEVQQQDQKQQQAQGQGSQSNAGETAKRRNPRRKRTVRLVVLAILVVAIIASIPIYAYYSVRETTDDAQVDGHIIPVSPRISGTIIEVLVDDNQLVRAGQNLVRLDPADYQVALDQSKAALANAEATRIESETNVPLTNINTRSQVSTSGSQVDEANAGVISAQRAVDAARARLASAEGALAEKQADYDKAQKDLIRYRDLVSKDEISKQDYDSAVAAAAANGADVDSAKADVLEAQHNLSQSSASVDQAKARLATAIIQRRQSQQVEPKQEAVSEARFKQAVAAIAQRQAELDQAQLNLGYTYITAPVDGIVSRKSAEPRQQVSPGQQIMAIVPLDNIWVTANFKETQLRKMQIGQQVEIEVDTFGSERKYRGHLDSFAAASGAKFSLLPPENATGNYVKVVQRVPVKITLDPGQNRDHRLLPGMSVEPTVLLNSATQ